MKIKSPLEELLIDEERIEERADQLLSTALKPYVNVTKTSKQVQLNDQAFRLPVRKLILIALATKLAMKRLNLIQDESMSQKELLDFLIPQGIPEGSIKSGLKQLRDRKLVSQKNHARYLVGLDKLPRLEIELKYEKQQ